MQISYLLLYYRFSVALSNVFNGITYALFKRYQNPSSVNSGYLDPVNFTYIHFIWKDNLSSASERAKLSLKFFPHINIIIQRGTKKQSSLIRGKTQ